MTERVEKERILVIDDSPTSLRAVKECLSADGYDIVLATSAMEGWGQIEKEEPDCIFLDVLMPEMSGIELCRKLKSDPVLRHIPVLLFTEHDATEDILAGFEASADDYVSKSADPARCFTGSTCAAPRPAIRIIPPPSRPRRD